jgi:UDP-N-acetylmuramyl pentapeptide phosphotransferase/UDP-N-acetylglucosamine-1-phosphate transferase
MNNLYLLISPLIILLVNSFFIKKNFLKSLTGDRHQLFIEKKNIPLSGGVFLFIFSIIPFFTNIEFYFFFTIFLIGVLSDTKILKSAKIRFMIQIVTIVALVINFNFVINDLRIPFLNLLLENKIFSYLFFSFCLLIVTNGTNFIDGLNGLVLGYYTIVLSFVLNLELSNNFGVNQEYIIYYIIILAYLLIFNFLNKLYLGDSGSYFLGFLVGILLISIYKQYPLFSPFYVVLLLWYPCFENLFSILRKYRFNSSPLKADNKHLHQLLFYYNYKKFNFSKLYANNIASLTINLVNLIFFLIGSNYIYDSSIQIIIILILLFIYILSYLFLFNFRFNKNN